MDSFIGTIAFLLPGLLLYFWLQSFGINPVVKHNPSEFTAYVVLFWFPISMLTLLFFNGCIYIAKFFTSSNFYIVSIDDLKLAINDFRFITAYLLLSTIISYIFAVVWSIWGNKFFREFLINSVRYKRKIAPFSEYPAVWDEVFLKDEMQIAEVGRVDKPDCPVLYGCIAKASRPFESERHLYVEAIKGFNKEFIKENKLIETHSFYDVKSGSYVKIFDTNEVVDALTKAGLFLQEDA